MTVSLFDIRAAEKNLEGVLVRTPLVKSKTLSEITGCSLYLKYENFQFTSSFKERGACHRLLQLDDKEKKNGVIAASIGNHAQAVARHAQRLSIPATIVMPRSTPIAKIQQTQFFEPTIELEGRNIVETLDYTRKKAKSCNLTLIHPYDDPAVVAGQGTIGLEILSQQKDLQTVVFPVGGGGLISGGAVAIKSLKPSTRIIGVQVDEYSGAYSAFKKLPPSEPTRVSVAEGIAVKRPGELNLRLIEKYVDDMVVVTEEQVETAILRLLEVEKVVSEGAGAASLAAVLAYRSMFSGTVSCVVSGGNIDMATLATVIQRGLVREQRIVHINVVISDVHGSLSELTSHLSALDSNIIEITHKRMRRHSTIGSTIVECTLQLRGQDQLGKVLDGLNKAGYRATPAETLRSSSSEGENS